MDEFWVLVVEDKRDHRKYLTTLLERDSIKVAGPGRRLRIREASNQDEAEAAVREAPGSGYSLIFLDVEYPLQADGRLEYIGTQWLPDLRKLQPDAAIVVFSEYGSLDGFRFVVESLRDGFADDFVPKGEPWEQVLKRVLAAIRDRRRKVLRKKPLTSNVARTSSEDILAALSRARSKIETEHQMVGPDRVGFYRAFDELEGELKGITARLIGKFTEVPEPINCLELATDEALLVESQLTRPILIEPFHDNPGIQTYGQDLRTALREILQNAVDATKEAGPANTESVILQIKREPDSKHLSISISDSGPGFAKPALNRLYEPGRSFWSRDRWRHKGMGLYVARRMMHSIGGDIAVGSSSANATTVSLFVRDWAQR